MAVETLGLVGDETISCLQEHSVLASKLRLKNRGYESSSGAAKRGSAEEQRRNCVLGNY